MDNLLAQVTGTKRVVLYSPQDSLYLYLSGQFVFTFFTFTFCLSVPFSATAYKAPGPVSESGLAKTLSTFFVI